MNRLLAPLMLLALAGCAQSGPPDTSAPPETSAPVESAGPDEPVGTAPENPPPPPPPAPPSVSPPEMTGSPPPMAIATRIFLPGNEPVPGRFGAVAVIIFPNGSDPARLVQVCRAFVAVLDDSGDVRERLPDAAQMVTIWPVKSGSALPRSGVVATAAAADRLCTAAAANYDYLRAQQAMAALPANERLAPATRGPLLAAWAPGDSFGRQRVAILRYDLSGVAGQQRLVGAMQVWKDKIERQPQLWQSGWNATKVRLWLSTQVDELGAQIGAAMKLVGNFS